MNYLCAVDNFLHDRPSGAARVALDIALLMRDNGHNVTIVCQRESSQKNAPAIAECQGIRVLRCKNLNTLPLPQGATWIKSAKNHVIKYLSDERFDVVHIHSLFTGKGVMEALGNSPCYIYTIHSPVVLEQRINWRHQGLKGRLKLLLGLNYLEKLERNLLRASSKIHALSQFTNTEIRQFHDISGDIDVIPHWVEIRNTTMTKKKARQMLGWPEKLPVIFTVRSHIPRTGVDVAIEALAPLTINNRCLFVVAGDGPLQKKYEQQAIEAGASSSQILFTGRLTEEQLNMAYQAADMFVLPTRELECFGLIILEALAHGCPVIGTNVGAIPELLNPILPNFIVPPNNPESLRAKTKDWLDNRISPPDKNTLIDHVQQHFSRKNIGQKLVDFITNP